MLTSIKQFLNILISEPSSPHLLYISLIDERWEGWTFTCGEREHIVSRGTKGEVEEWAEREGWEVVEI